MAARLLPVGVACSEGAIARLDPRCKLAVALVAGLAIAILQTLPCLLAAFIGTFLLLLAARIPFRWLLPRLAAVAPFAVFVVVLMPLFLRGGAEWRIGWLTFSPRGALAALKIGLRMLTLLGLALVVLGTTRVHVLLQAARRLGLPGLFAQMALLTHRYLFLLGSELRRLRTALRVRGYRNRANVHGYRVAGRLAGTVLVRSSERADRVAQAMRCRAFDGTFRSLEPMHASPIAVCASVLGAVFAAGLVLLDCLAR